MNSSRLQKPIGLRNHIMKTKPRNVREMFRGASKAFVSANTSILTRLRKENALHSACGYGKGMNRAEVEYSLVLERERRAGEIQRYRFEAVKVRVGEGCFYVPDFFVERDGGKPLFVEVKGFLRDDARVKFLAAKELHDWADWQMWRKGQTGWERIA